MPTPRRRHALPCLALALVLAPARARGQANDEVDAGIQFNFSLPGARSLAMGGAFLAAADDATAAYTNPSGLTALRTPEASFEGRLFRYHNEFISGGHAPGNATGYGQDTHTGLTFDTTVDTTASASFVSFVYPAGRWSFALYRHQLADFEAHGAGGGEYLTLSPDCDGLNPYSVCRRGYFKARLDLAIESYGVAAALRASDTLHLGIAVAYDQAKLRGTTGRYPSTVYQQSVFTGIPPNYAAANTVATTIQRIDDGSVAFNVGAVWRPTRWLSVGGVYRQGPRFDFTADVIQGPFLLDICPTCFHDVHIESTYHVPDVYGLGVMLHGTRVPLRVAFDVNRVRYSMIMRGFVNIVAGIANDASFEKTTPTYSIDDGTEIRLGVEYVLTHGRWPVALRAGLWRDPAHRLKNDGSVKPAEKYRFVGGEDEVHETAGIGVVVGRRLQLDAAIDVGRSYSAASLSAVVFF